MSVRTRHEEALEAAADELNRNWLTTGGAAFIPAQAECAVRAYLTARADEPGKIRYIDDPFEKMSPSAASHLLADFEVSDER